MPVTQSPEIEVKAPIAEETPERIPEVAPGPVAPVVEAAPAPVEAPVLADEAVAKESTEGKAKSVSRPVARPKKGKKLAAHFHRGAHPKRKAEPTEKMVTVAPPAPIIVPVIKKDTKEDVLAAFAWLNSEKISPAMAKRLKKIEESRLEKLADSGLEELPQLNDYSEQVSATQEIALDAKEEEIEIVYPNLIRFAEYKANDFSDVKAKLKLYRSVLDKVEVAAPKTVAVPNVAQLEALDTQSEASREEEVAAKFKTNPEMEEELETEPAGETEKVPELVKAEPQKRAEPVAEPAVPEEEKNVLVRPSAPAEEAHVAEVQAPIVVPTTQASPISPNSAFEMMATGGGAPKKAAPSETNVLVDTHKPAENVATQEKPKPIIHLADSRGGRQNLIGTDPDVVYGKFSVDKGLDQLLAAKNGHIEIQLIPESAKDLENVRRPVLQYSYPTDGANFDIPRGKLDPKYNYKMYAKVFLADELLPKASIAFKGTINPFVREQLRFRVTKRQYDEFLAYGSNVPSRDHFLYVTVVEGMEGNREQPKTLSNARVRIVGYPASENKFQAMGDGNFKLNGITNRSEVLLEVEADGYLRTDKVVSIFGSDNKALVYLLSKKGVEAVRGWFTDKAIDPEKSIVVGRDFNPKVAGETVQGEEISMQYRNGPTVYFGSVFPDLNLKSTSESGMFAFFNLAPAFRAIYRETIGKLPYLMNIRPHSGYFVDLGRGALRSVKGQLFDTLNGLYPEARISVLGQKDNRTFETDGRHGKFEVKNIDVTNDVVMLKVQNDNYPTFLYPVAVDSKENLADLKLFMLDKKRYDEVLQDLPGPSVSGLGVAMGGAEASLFAQSPGCLKVELTDATSEKPVDPKSGPFSWGSPDARNSTCFDQSNPRWAARLKPGQYISRWVDKDGKTVRSHVFIVERDTPTMVIN